MDSTINTLRAQQIEQCKPWIAEMARRHGVEDLYQEVWVQCLQLDTSEIDWTKPQQRRIRAIARRQWQKERHTARRRAGTLSYCSVNPSRLPDPREAEPPLERLVREEAFATAVVALSRCNRRQRMAFEQHFLRAEPDSVIAARWRVRVEAIRRWRNQALWRLRAELGAVA